MQQAQAGKTILDGGASEQVVGVSADNSMIYGPTRGAARV